MRNLSILLLVILALVGVPLLVANLRPARPTVPAPEPVSAEQVGEKVGSAAAGFGRGVADGVRRRLSAKPTER